MSRCIPEGSVPTDTPSVGQWLACPVCRVAPTYYCDPRGGADFRLADFRLIEGCRCETCNLFECGRHSARVGFKWLTDYDALWRKTPLLEECVTLHARRAEWAAFPLVNAMDWLVLADWLEDAGFPLNAAGIRANFSSPFEEYK